jgi:hypothetical protein
MGWKAHFSFSTKGKSNPDFSNIKKKIFLIFDGVLGTENIENSFCNLTQKK